MKKLADVIKLNDYRSKKVSQPICWVNFIFLRLKEIQRKREKEKIDALLDAAYKFYLDLYLSGVELKKLIDIHPALYKRGYTINSLAYQMAMEQMIKVIRDKRVDECYKNLQKHIKGKKNERRTGLY